MSSISDMMDCKRHKVSRNLAVYKRPIGATLVYFDGSHANG